MSKMTPVEIRAFLLEGTRTGKLATVRADGRPHVAPIWFEMDGEDLIFTTWHETVKAANLNRDPRASLCVDDQVPPFSFVLVEGRVTISTDAEQRGYWTHKIAQRYMGSELADEYGARNNVEGELLLRLHPEKIIAQKNLAD